MPEGFDELNLLSLGRIRTTGKSGHDKKHEDPCNINILWTPQHVSGTEVRAVYHILSVTLEFLFAADRPK